MGGVVMSVLPLERVRGEHNMAAPPVLAIDVDAVLPVGPALTGLDLGGPIREVRLQAWRDRPVYFVATHEGST